MLPVERSCVMNGQVLVDSSAWIEFLRPDGDQRVADRVQQALQDGAAAWSEMIMIELWNGAGGEQEWKRLRRLQSVLPVLDVPTEVWTSARALARSMRKSGKTVPATDLLVFATACHHRASVLHHDQHFDWLQAHGPM